MLIEVAPADLEEIVVTVLMDDNMKLRVMVKGRKLYCFKCGQKGHIKAECPPSKPQEKAVTLPAIKAAVPYPPATRAASKTHELINTMKRKENHPAPTDNSPRPSPIDNNSHPDPADTIPHSTFIVTDLCPVCRYDASPYHL